MGQSEYFNNQHWVREEYRQRMTTKQWREILLDDDDSVIFKGLVRKLIGKSIGHGVVEVFKEPLADKGE